MTDEIILTALVRLNLVATTVILLVLALRPFLLRWFGARLAYWCWLVVPLATASSLLPAREVIEFIEPSESVVAIDETVGVPEIQPLVPTSAAGLEEAPPEIMDYLAAFLVAGWLVGIAALLGRSIFNTRHFVSGSSVSPALVGVFRTRLVLPADFHTRFNSEERELILAHEDQHRRSGHSIVNALVEIARCACWFNPFAHLAARRFRLDQELACDAAVISANPGKRRVYAEALLKAQVSPDYLHLVSTWSSRSTRHLVERIKLLNRPNQPVFRVVLGVLFLAVVNLAAGYTVWAQQPERRVTQVTRPPATWTPSSEAPAGTLSHQLEARRHDHFNELAQTVDIDLLFFGTTDTEMWWWDRGRDVWDRRFGSLKAANFGSQGTGPHSLLWRMRNGELDGFDAKLIVLQAWGRPDLAVPEIERTEYAEGFAPIIAEIRTRQPDAKLLLMAPLPRGGRLEQWKQQAAGFDGIFASLVDNESVFYANFGESFYNEDGSFKTETWSRGRQTPGFEIWAEALQPWLARFL